jgi:hypothetical protein
MNPHPFVCYTNWGNSMSFHVWHSTRLGDMNVICNSSKFVCKDRIRQTRTQSKRDNHCDTHDEYRVAFSLFNKCYTRGGVLWTDKKGQVITLKPYTLIVIYNTSGHNELCGHYGSCVATCLAKTANTRLKVWSELNLNAKPWYGVILSM